MVDAELCAVKGTGQFGELFELHLLQEESLFVPDARG